MKNKKALFDAIQYNKLNRATLYSRTYGSYYFALCIFKDEQTDSFILVKDKVSIKGWYNNVWAVKDLDAGALMNELHKLKEDTWSCDFLELVDNLELNNIY